MTHNTHGGFTLVEVLVVVVLIAMTASAGLVSIAGAGRAAELERTAAAIKELDLRGRLEGRRGRACAIRIDDKEHDLVLVGRLSGEVIERASTPNPARVALLDPVTGLVVEGVNFDRRGTCADYLVDVGQGDLRRRWLVSGATGWRAVVP